MKVQYRLVLFISVVVALVGISVLIGWYFDISVLKTIIPGFISMKANTALLFILMSMALLFSGVEKPNSKTSSAIVLLSVVTILVSIITLAEYIFDLQTFLDEFLFTDNDGVGGRFPPGRLAPITAVNFIILSVGFLLNLFRSEKFYSVLQFLAILVFFSGFQAAFGYSIGLSYVFGSAFYTQMALHTALSFIILSCGVLCLKPSMGYLKAFTSTSETSKMAKRLLLSVLFIPPLTRWVANLGAQAKFFDQDFATLTQVIGSIVLMTFIVLTAAKALYEIEEKRKLALEHEIQARHEAESSVRARDHFLSIASHELKTPISSLTLQNELTAIQLEKGDLTLTKPERLKEIFELSDRQVKWLSRVVDDMLDVSTITSGKLSLALEEHDLYKLVEESVSMQRKIFDSFGIKLTFGGEHLKVICDCNRIEQVLTNLLTNAFKYGDRSEVKVIVRKENEWAQILISDSGRGIAQKDLKRIFERFERAVSASEVSGLGLGLFISKEIVEHHHGKLEVQSETGKGSTFIVSLPARNEKIR